MPDDKPIRAFDNRQFLHSREARVIRIMSEYIEPEKRFTEMGIRHTVVFFGSARIDPDSGPMSRYYDTAAEFAFELASLSKEIENETGSPIYICTGGGPGIMEAANMGAKRAGALTIGLNIELPFEQSPNKYISPEVSFQFHYFFMRKLWFLYQAKAVIVFPGGFGTMDELFEVLTLVQTRKLEKMDIPILLVDEEFWRETINFDGLVKHGFISPEDLELFHYCSDVKEGIAFLRPRLVELIRNMRPAIMKFPL
ncbi:MAG: LOG family protein [Spirochaetes bacterium]|nr:LOG family protein [Spirochaetota bacterium]